MRRLSPRLILVTAGSLTGSMIAGSLSGAAFWWVATSFFEPETVGVAVGWLAAMSLVASLSLVGGGTLLVRDLHRAGAEAAALVGTATLAAGAVAVCAGVAFALLAPVFSPEFASLARSPLAIVLFAIGVALTAMAAVIDEVLLGLLRARLRLLRNLVFNGAKIALLVAAGLLVAAEDPRLIAAAWVAGVAISLLVLTPHLPRFWAARPIFSLALLGRMVPGAISHQALNFVMGLPALGIPVLVALNVAPSTTAQFYIAFMLASVSFYAPHALSQTLYAVGSRSMELLAEHTRFTAGLSLLSGLATVAGLTVLAEPVLSLFGPQYAEAAPIVPVLAAVAIPILVKDHFTVVYRIRHREHAALALCGGGALLELGAASFGLAAAGLAGLAWAWLLAVAGESLVMGPPLLRALGSGPGGEAPELATSGTS